MFIPILSTGPMVYSIVPPPGTVGKKINQVWRPHLPFQLQFPLNLL